MRPPIPAFAILAGLLTGDLAVSALTAAETTARSGPENGLVTVESAASFETTYDRLRSAIADNPNLRILAEIDHAANAEGVGRTLPPTRLIVFGNPKLGTPLMRSGRTVAIDLPQKVLVWEDEAGVHVAYNHPEYLARRHGLEARDEIMETIAGALDGLTAAATR